MCRGTQVPAPRARRHARMQARAGHGGLSFPTGSTRVDQAPALASAVLLRSGAPGRTSRHASQRSVGLGGRALTVASRCVRRPLRPPSPKRLVFFLKAAQLNEIRHSVHPLPNGYGRKRKCNCNCAHKEGRRLVPGSLKSDVGRGPRCFHCPCRSQSGQPCDSGHLGISIVIALVLVAVPASDHRDLQIGRIPGSRVQNVSALVECGN